MQDAYAERRRMLAEAEVSIKSIDTFLLHQLNINLGAVQSERIAIKPLSALAGGRFDFEAVVTLPALQRAFSTSAKLKHLCQHIDERVTPASDMPDDLIHYVSLGHIASNMGTLVNFEPTLGKEVLSASPMFKKGDILFGRMRPYLNKVWLAEFDGVCSGEAIVLRPSSEQIDPIFLHALLLNQITLDQVVPLQSGTSLPRVSAQDILNISLPLPASLQHQQAIATEISRRRAEARRLRSEAERIVSEAKAIVERMILGEEAL
jgi:hypothetical protein